MRGNEGAIVDMKDYETIARNSHRSGMNCAASVYNAFANDNKNATKPPVPRSEGGKCGAVLAAEQIISEMGGSQDKVDEFDKIFAERFGSLKCAELRGLLNNKCNDYVEAAAYMAATM